ncbi:MAG: branched-chain-amino-acid transaminase [Endomicrobium sp.]|jgi:branched-chain amino acid aminotransferase|nr:branched-chain-amino-acid transaminase [Endomicrobium sp.]
MMVYIDGKFFDKKEAKISIFDYGLLYGYGIFEDIRAYNGRIFRLKEHLEKLWSSAKTINLVIDLKQKDIESAILKTLKVNQLLNGYIKVLITKVNSNLNSTIRENKTSLIIMADNDSSFYIRKLCSTGIKVSTSHIHTINNSSFLTNIKSLNYLNHFLSELDAIKGGFDTAVILNSNGTVTGCSFSNLFIVKNGIISTPSLSEGVLLGITRDTVIELARNKLSIIVKENPITMYSIYNADECFLTSTINEIIPIISIDTRIISNGKPGFVTLKLIKEFKNLVMATGIPIK